MNDDDTGNCRACKIKVMWAYTQANKKMPVDIAEAESGKGNLTLYRSSDGTLRVCVVKVGEGRFVPHFATCVKRAKRPKSPAI